MKRLILLAALAVFLLPSAALSDGNGTVVYKDIQYSDTPPLLLDVYEPEAITDDTPLLVWIPSSGGFRWDKGMKDAYGTAGPMFAERGLIAVVPEHRLAPDVLFPNFVQDIAAAVAWSWQHYPTAHGETRPIIVGGDGTGAYVGAVLSLDARYLGEEGLPAGAVAGFIGQAGTYLGGGDCVMRPCRAFFPEDLRADWTVPGLLDPGDPPMLLIAGEEDETEGIDALEALAGPAARARIDVTTLVVPRRVSFSLFLDLLRPGTAVHETVDAFVDRLAPR